MTWKEKPNGKRSEFVLLYKHFFNEDQYKWQRKFATKDNIKDKLQKAKNKNPDVRVYKLINEEEIKFDN